MRLDDDYSGDYEDVKAEFAAEARTLRRYRQQLSAHPDSRDPDWPGHWAPEEEEGDS